MQAVGYAGSRAGAHEVAGEDAYSEPRHRTRLVCVPTDAESIIAHDPRRPGDPRWIAESVAQAPVGDEAGP